MSLGINMDNVGALLEIPFVCPLCSCKVEIKERLDRWYVIGDSVCSFCGDFGIDTDTERQLTFLWNLSVEKCRAYERECLKREHNSDVIFQNILTLIDLLDDNDDRVNIAKCIFGNYLFPNNGTDKCLVRNQPKNFVKLRFYKDV